MDNACQRWLLGIYKPSGRLMRWRLHLLEFDFKTIYKKGTLNTQDDAKSRLETTAEASPVKDEDISCFMVTSLEAEAENLTDDVCDDILVTEQSEAPAGSFVPITPEKRYANKKRTSFAHRFAPFSTLDNRFLFRSMTKDIYSGLLNVNHRLWFPHALQQKFLHLFHFVKVGAHPGGRKIYLTLRRDLYWPAMAFDCNAIRRSCADCAKNDVKLRKYSKSLTLFPGRAPLDFSLLTF